MRNTNKTFFLFYFHGEVPYLKIRFSEQNTKQKRDFFFYVCIFERKYHSYT